MQHDHLVDYITADTADDPLAVRILPWTAWRNCHFFDAYVLDALLKMLTVGRVAVSQEVPWGCIPGKRLDDLLGGPLWPSSRKHRKKAHSIAFSGNALSPA